MHLVTMYNAVNTQQARHNFDRCSLEHSTAIHTQY